MLFESCWCYRILLFFHHRHKASTVPAVANWAIFKQTSLCAVLNLATAAWCTGLGIHQGFWVFHLAECSVRLHHTVTNFHECSGALPELRSALVLINLCRSFSKLCKHSLKWLGWCKYGQRYRSTQTYLQTHPSEHFFPSAQSGLNQNHREVAGNQVIRAVKNDVLSESLKSKSYSYLTHKFVQPNGTEDTHSVNSHCP